jgi:hypothetical protein
VAVAWGVAVLWFYGFRIFAGLINPMDLIHFGVAAYFGLAVMAAFALFVLKDAWLLGFIVPAAALIGVDMMLHWL